MSARDHILQRLRQAPQGAVPVPPDVWGFQAAAGAAAGTADRGERIRLFCEKMAFWRGEVVRASRDDWPATLRELCLAKGVRSLLHGERHAAALAGSGIAGLRCYDRPVEEWKTELFRDIDASLTSTRGGIAETGTLIIWPDASEPRLLSLVPPIHFALLDADHIHANLLAAIGAQDWSGNLPTNALLVSGPSKTADIQVTLAYGAHGPKELVVLLLDGEDLP
ncbi:LUD domain-containing protein [Accumulibacter sp.]|uniref:LutC/YkgG family protein n=1 Tax=Accumulibacter sp. TaxID=2053492 RepID=UPI0025D036A4|nr:LUD domain-containing protein [Accumulibacter sp.]MCM8611210.1 lactate utilization protein [Accumulibacter sp.]MCM8634356.1 lactate utilization protein [Accumulibacter sp.]MCM8641612.1 lactate utilization protein [Accumulibacter sp.]